MKFRVAFSDTIIVDPQSRESLDGIGTYTRELRRCLVANSDVELVPVVMGARAVNAAPAGTLAFKGSPPIVAALSIVFGRTWPGAAALAERADVYLATDYRVPRLRGIPVCATAYDTIPLSHPQWANPWMRRPKNWILRNLMRRADRVLAISQAMVPEIVEHYGVDEKRIVVVPLGVADDWFVASPPQRIAKLLAQFGISGGYFLSVGTLQPRKNIERVVDAYKRLPAHVRADHALLVVGKVGWSAEATVELLRSSASAGVRWLERVSDADLRALYQGAKAFVFPSLYEGFGLPVVEAFASGAPVIASNVTSLPEIAGDAACLVDPYDVDAIAMAMRRVVEDSSWASELRQRGVARARQFSWDTCAMRTVEVLRSMV